jgi:SCY1-like protein 2
VKVVIGSTLLKIGRTSENLDRNIQQGSSTMDSVFAAASSFFSRTNISQSYNIGSPSGGLPGVPGLTGSRPVTPGSTSASLAAPAAATPPFSVGSWKVQSAWHKVTSKRVSVWTFDKRGSDLERLNAAARERAIEVLKAEVGAFITL